MQKKLFMLVSLFSAALAVDAQAQGQSPRR